MGPRRWELGEPWAFPERLPAQTWPAWIQDAARDPETQSGRETALQECPLSEPAGRGGLHNLSGEVGCEGDFEGGTT